MRNWFKRWSSFDSARSLGDYVFWGVCILFNTSGAALTAWAAAYTQWYWDAYGLIGVAFAFLVAVVIIPLGTTIFAGGALIAAKAKHTWRNTTPSLNGGHENKSLEDLQSGINESAVDVNRKLDALKDTLVELSQRTSEIDGVVRQHSGSFTSLELKSSENAKALGEVWASIEAARTDHRALHDRVYDVFKAKQIESFMLRVDSEIKALVPYLKYPTVHPEQKIKWDEWEACFTDFKSKLENFATYYSRYGEIKDDLFSLIAGYFKIWKLDL